MRQGKRGNCALWCLGLFLTLFFLLGEKPDVLAKTGLNLEWRPIEGVGSPPSETTTKGSLYVEARPDGALIRILNIAPKFQQGIMLDPGRYLVEVSANGYETQKEWIELKDGEKKRFTVQLERQISRDAEAEQARIQEERAKLEQERRELERLKAEQQRKERELKEQEAARLASVNRSRQSQAASSRDQELKGTIVLDPSNDQDDSPYRALYYLPPVQKGDKIVFEGEGVCSHIIINDEWAWSIKNGKAKELVVPTSSTGSLERHFISFWDPDKPLKTDPLRIRIIKRN